MLDIIADMYADVRDMRESLIPSFFISVGGEISAEMTGWPVSNDGHEIADIPEQRQI